MLVFDGKLHSDVTDRQTPDTGHHTDTSDRDRRDRGLGYPPPRLSPKALVILFSGMFLFTKISVYGLKIMYVRFIYLVFVW